MTCAWHCSGSGGQSRAKKLPVLEQEGKPWCRQRLPTAWSARAFLPLSSTHLWLLPPGPRITWDVQESQDRKHGREVAPASPAPLSGKRKLSQNPQRILTITGEKRHVAASAFSGLINLVISYHLGLLSTKSGVSLQRRRGKDFGVRLSCSLLFTG